MRVVADANALFSCLIKDGLSRRIWLHPGIFLVAPEFLLVEASRHRLELLQKASGSPQEFLRVFSKVLSRVKLVPDMQLDPYMPAAASLIADKKDWLYLACALKEDAIIWSRDGGFTKQTRITVRSTAELARELGLLE